MLNDLHSKQVEFYLNKIILEGEKINQLVLDFKQSQQLIKIFVGREILL